METPEIPKIFHMFKKEKNGEKVKRKWDKYLWKHSVCLHAHQYSTILQYLEFVSQVNQIFD